jgi:hypothetical protein
MTTETSSSTQAAMALFTRVSHCIMSAITVATISRIERVVISSLYEAEKRPPLQTELFRRGHSR